MRPWKSTTSRSVCVQGLLLAALPIWGCSGTWHSGAALHVVRAGRLDNLALVFLEDVHIRPTGVDGLGPSDGALTSGFRGNWFYVQPGTYTVGVRSGSGIALNEVAHTITVEPGGMYELSQKDKLPVFRQLPPDADLGREAALKAASFGAPPKLQTAPGVEEVKGVALFMSEGIEEIQHFRRSDRLVLRGGGDLGSLSSGHGYIGMPSYLLELHPGSSDWTLSVLVPPTFAASTADLGRARHMPRSPAGQALRNRRTWGLRDLTSDDAGIVVGSDFKILSLAQNGWADAKELLGNTEVEALWQGDWDLGGAKISPDGAYLVFEACPFDARPPRACRIGKVDLNTREITDLGRGLSPAISRDGERLAFVQHKPSTGRVAEIHLLALASPLGAPRILKTGGLAPLGLDWSPDGKTLAFAGRAPDRSGANIHVMRVSDGSITPITQLPSYQAGKDQRQTCRSPSWTPNGRLVFTCTWYQGSRGHGTIPEIWRVRPPR